MLLVRNRMIGWPTLAPCRHTSSAKPGCRCVPNTRLKMSTQEKLHDGVAALADIAPTAPTPPTRVSVAAAAKTLFLMDMDSSSYGTTAVPCARLSSCHRVMPADRGQPGHRPRWLDTER